MTKISYIRVLINDQNSYLQENTGIDLQYFISHYLQKFTVNLLKNNKLIDLVCIIPHTFPIE
ncbi:hypothetical protein PTE_01893 [Photorhabdus khanii NC19]|uniref:Uncharacterized protein n=1 Tax=Photorhabdus khanii NC19 TaxID=1004151 RepID=W3V782_9GAMM|nr:hypothetical protein PTE_01893 [Photorhabdus khanii NC19]